MSAIVSDCLMPFKEGTDMSEVKAFAEEITRKASLDLLGYDITDPVGNPAKEYQRFSIGNDALCWSDYTGCDKHLDVPGIIKQIAHHFPETEFIYSVYWEGPMVSEEYIKGNVREKLVRKVLDVGIDNPEARRKVMTGMPDAEQSGPFLLFHFKQYPVSKLYEAADEITSKVAQIIPDTTLYCVMVDDDDEGYYFSEKGVFSDGKIIWEDMTWDERDIINDDLHVRENNPTDAVLAFLIKALEIKNT